MNSQVVESVTALLQDWKAGDQEAYQRLYSLVYDELKRQAHHYLRRERSGHTLQTTDLVHEVYLRLREVGQVDLSDHGSLLAFTASVMRRVLVDWARQRGRAKRGGDRTRVTFDEALKFAPDNYDEIVMLDDALQALEKFDSHLSQIVELRYFGGLTIEETAAELGVSIDHVKRQWRSAKRWLYRELTGTGESANGSRAMAAD
jgi:RNA polymerase sigma-70 factor, ECF subfamily